MRIEKNNTPWPLGLCIWGMTYSAGICSEERRVAKPMTALDLLNLCADLDLKAFEVSVDLISKSHDKNALRAFAQEAADRGITIVLSGPGVDGREDAMHKQIQAAQDMGVKTVRCVLSSILCADRRPIGGLAGWRAHLDKCIDRLKRLMPAAEAAGVRIAVENHQDATSDDLVMMCQRVDSSNLGITMDVGNALAVGEDPGAFAAKVQPFLVNVHLKDYEMFDTQEGFRLVRCAIGSGVVDFEAVMKVLQTKTDIAYSFEMAALEARHIRILAADYWQGLGKRDISDLLPVLNLWHREGKDGEYRTPWEMGNDADMPDYELGQLYQSIRNFNKLYQQMSSNKNGKS